MEDRTAAELCDCCCAQLDKNCKKCFKAPVLKLLIELGYFAETEAFDNLIFLVNKAAELIKNDNKPSRVQALTNLQVVNLHLSQISEKSDDLIDLKIKCLKIKVEALK